MATTATHEAVVRGVMEQWKAGIDAHEPERIAARFTPDAIFQGLHPYAVGPAAVAEYYAGQPLGMKADYTVLETRQVGEDAVLGYLGVDFSYTDRPTRSVWISVLITRGPTGWGIGHYQVSKLD